MVAIDTGLLLALQVDIAFYPGAEVVRVLFNAILGLAGLDAAKTADAASRIYAVCPAMLRPVIVLGRK